MFAELGWRNNPGNCREISCCRVGNELLCRHNIFPIGAIADMFDCIERRPDIAFLARRRSIIAPAIALRIQLVGKRLKIEASLLQMGRAIALLHADLLVRDIAPPSLALVTEGAHISIASVFVSSAAGLGGYVVEMVLKARS